MTTKVEAPTVQRLAWPAFDRWFRRTVQPGEHGVIIGSTGSGKSVLARKIVPYFGRNIVVLDGKGGDDPSLQIPGFQLATAWPPPQERAGFLHGLTGRERPPIRVVLTTPITGFDSYPKMRDLFEHCLRDLMPRKGSHVFTLYIDEAQIISDPIEGMGLKRFVGPLLRTKRYHGMSIVQSTQFPTWIGKASYRETTHRFLFRLDDEDSQTELAKIAGSRRLVETLNGLRRHEFLYFYRPDQRYVVSRVAGERGPR